MVVFFMAKRNCRIARNNISRQERSHISRAFTEFEIGAEDLEKAYCDITETVMIALPDVIKHVEKDDTGAEQEANPDKFWRQE